MRYPTLPNGVSRYGSQMGRPDVVEEPGTEARFHLYRMPMVDCCYDSGGAYGGMGDSRIGWMYHAYSDGPDGRNECFVRATSREKAKAEVRDVFRNARFYR